MDISQLRGMPDNLNWEIMPFSQGQYLRHARSEALRGYEQHTLTLAESFQGCSS